MRDGFGANFCCRKKCEIFAVPVKFKNKIKMFPGIEQVLLQNMQFIKQNDPILNKLDSAKSEINRVDEIVMMYRCVGRKCDFRGVEDGIGESAEMRLSGIQKTVKRSVNIIADNQSTFRPDQLSGFLLTSPHTTILLKNETYHIPSDQSTEAIHVIAPVVAPGGAPGVAPRVGVVSIGEMERQYSTVDIITNMWRWKTILLLATLACGATAFYNPRLSPANAIRQQILTNKYT